MTTKIHGRLGAADLAAATDTAAYSVPVLRKATCSVSFCNRTGSATTVRLAHVPGAIGTVALSDYKEFDTPLAANGVLERTGMPMAAGASILARAAAVGVSVVVEGIEEDA